MEQHDLERILNDARQEAVKRRNYYTTTEHFLLVLLREQEIIDLFSDYNIPMAFVIAQLERFFKQALEQASPREASDRLGEPTDGLNDIISRGVVHALSSGREFPRPIDFLILMIGQQDSFAAALFKAIGVRQVDLMHWASEHPDGVAANDEDLDPIELDEDDDDEDEDDVEYAGAEDDDDEEASSAQSFSRMKEFMTRLVRLAKAHKIDPVVGRDREIDICCRALLRRTKCNVLIVGEAGVGKTAIVEGLARRIALGKVPQELSGSEIYSIDIPSLMAGTKFRGEMEARLKSVLKFIKKQKKAILFIDELHSAAGTDKSTGSQEIIALLKPELAKGNIRLIGTTTYEDFRRVLSSDSALLRRFHKLDIEEPDLETTCKIIKEIAPHYESFHKVSYTPEALDEAVKLAGRYMPDKRFPDKAIDVIDEAGAVNRMKPLCDQLKTLDVPQIETVVANIARIPDLRVSKDETDQLKTAESRLKSVVFGQDKAIEAVVKLVKLSRAGIRMPDKPVASLLFAGPTGVGKTEVAKQLAHVLDLPFVRFDMSEYREEYTVSKFIGSAPGYVGYERGGLLTEAIRSKPNCVLLLDEIEKAHSSIYDLLLQVMDVAKLTDNTGKSADFRNVILIMTSNAGSLEMSKVRIGFGAEIDPSMGMNDIEKTFSPEFRNRLDEIVMFNALTSEHMGRIVERMVSELETQLSEKNIHLHLTDDAKSWLAEKGYDQKFGARPMARLIQREISLPLADLILFGNAKNGGSVRISLKADGSGLDLGVQ
ncbi:MAG: AAA family ATPase [Proteobacteria bacterium]|nr:AAA family ATPase [Pseudomonadota bacterium]